MLASSHLPASPTSTLLTCVKFSFLISKPQNASQSDRLMIYVMRFVPFNLRFICVVYKNTEWLSWMDSQLAQDWWVEGLEEHDDPSRRNCTIGRMVGDYLCYVWVDNLRSIPGGGKIDNWCGNEFPRFSPLRLCSSQQKKSDEMKLWKRRRPAGPKCFPQRISATF